MNVKIIFIMSIILSIILMAQMDFGYTEIPHLTPPTTIKVIEPIAYLEKLQ